VGAALWLALMGWLGLAAHIAMPAGIEPLEVVLLLAMFGAGAAVLLAGAVVAHERAQARLAAELDHAWTETRHQLQALFASQAEQLEALRREAHVDALTGLATRRHFLTQLGRALDSGLPRLGLVILRVSDVPGMNRRIGREASDHVLQSLAQTLMQYPHRTDGCLAGRLNGTDFALALPVAGVARETAQALVNAMRVPLVSVDGATAVCAGVVELAAPVAVGVALTLADEALARAEAAGAFRVVQVDHAPPDPPLGEATWQQHLADALHQGNTSLGAYPVCAADSRVLYLDCPLRMHLGHPQDRRVAAHWLPMAGRARLCAQVDEHVLGLALQAIAADGQGRCINFAAQSLGFSAFVAQATRMIELAQPYARQLWIDLPESLALERPGLVRDVALRWGAAGVQVGLEHVGDALARIPGLQDMGLTVVRVDSCYVEGVGAPAAADLRRHLRALVQLAHGLGLSITAEGVRDAADLEQLWALGFDAATGPAVQPMSPQYSG
jgi:EAL domain-containing protein (putative c-di-GMP-specific phosphodiesterase class I)/GGDEF domain-containing protein